MLASNQQDIAQLAKTLGPRLEKLVVYYQGVPAETARFTRDKAMLDEVSRLSQQRIQAIQELVRLLAGYS
jgi:mevalonate kinase